MKKYILPTLALSATLFMGNVNAEGADETSNIRLLSECSMEEIENFFKGESQIILECSEGVSLPFEWLLNGQEVDLEGIYDSEEMTATLLKKLYVTFDGNDLLFSDDAENWETIESFLQNKLGDAFEFDGDYDLLVDRYEDAQDGDEEAEFFAEEASQEEVSNADDSDEA